MSEIAVLAARFAPLRALARLARRLVPDSLFGRLVLILVAGMFSAQLLTGTIWSQAHDNRTLEIPARVFASRLADTVRLLDGVSDGAQRREIVSRLADQRYRMTWIPVTALQPGVSVAGPIARQSVNDLISGVIRRRLGRPIDIRLLDAHLSTDDDGRHAGVLALFNSRKEMGDFHVQLRLPEGDALDIRANEGQAGMQAEPEARVLDYLLRVYILRLIAIFLFALLAVRLAVGPLKRLTKAAAALGKNMHRSPLPEEGPRELRSAAMTFNAMQRQLVESMGERTRLLTAVSHDLRSPLTRLRLRVEMLSDTTARERLRSDLGEMEAMVRHTLKALQGVEITEMRREINIDSMIDGLIEDAREAGEIITRSGSALGTFGGFPSNLKRCLQNLVDNGIRYGGQVSIDIVDTVDCLTICIRDRGPGIADRVMLERVFEPYVRLASAHGAAHDGTGLGLTISRSIAAAHGGTLTLRNRSDGAGLEAVLVLLRDEAGSGRRRPGGMAGS